MENILEISGLVVGGIIWSSMIVMVTAGVKQWNDSWWVKWGTPLIIGAITGAVGLSEAVLSQVGIPVSSWLDGGVWGIGAGSVAHSIYGLVKKRLQRLKDA